MKIARWQHNGLAHDGLVEDGKVYAFAGGYSNEDLV